MNSDQELTAYLWPSVRENVKTAIENRQNLIVSERAKAHGVDYCLIDEAYDVQFEV